MNRFQFSVLGSPFSVGGERSSLPPASEASISSPRSEATLGEVDRPKADTEGVRGVPPKAGRGESVLSSQSSVLRSYRERRADEEVLGT